MRRGIEGDRADVVEVGAGDRRPVDLRLHHRAAHHGPPSVAGDAPRGRRSPPGRRHGWQCCRSGGRRRRGRRPRPATSPSSASTGCSVSASTHLGVLERAPAARSSSTRRTIARAPCRRRARRRRTAIGRGRERPRRAPWPPRARRATGTRCGSTSRARRARARAGSPTTVDRQVEVGGHPPHHRELLAVLAPEVRRARADDREQLGHDRGDAVEVAGPAPRRTARR